MTRPFARGTSWLPAWARARPASPHLLRRMPEVSPGVALARASQRYALSQAIIASLFYAKHFFQVCAFARHGTGVVTDFAAPPRRAPPTPTFEVAPFMQSAKCPLCYEALLRTDDIHWDDKKQSWACDAGLVVPYKGGFAHPSCLPQKAHMRTLGLSVWQPSSPHDDEDSR